MHWWTNLGSILFVINGDAVDRKWSNEISDALLLGLKT